MDWSAKIEEVTIKKKAQATAMAHYGNDLSAGRSVSEVSETIIAASAYTLPQGYSKPNRQFVFRLTLSAYQLVIIITVDKVSHVM